MMSRPIYDQSFLEPQGEMGPQLATLVGTKILHALESHPNDVERELSSKTLDACCRTIASLDDVDLLQLEMLPQEADVETVQYLSAPIIQSIREVVEYCINQLSSIYKLDIQNDSALPEYAGASGPEDSSAEHNGIKQNVDPWLDTENGRELRDSVHSLVGMLQFEGFAFNRRLQAALASGNRWSMLSEIQEFQNRCAKCFEAISVLSLRAIVGDAEPVERMFPRYMREGLRGATLRARVVELAHEVQKIAHLLAEGDDGIQQCWEKLNTVVKTMTQTRAYTDMRAQDKHEFTNFRHWLLAQKVSATHQELAVKTEGFLRFLELLRGINQRLEVLTYDVQMLDEICKELAGGASPNDVLFPRARSLLGRDEELDVLLLGWIPGLSEPTHENLLKVLRRVRDQIS